MAFKIVKIWMIVILLLAPFLVADANGNTDLKTGGIENTERSAIATDARESQPFTYDFLLATIGEIRLGPNG